MLGTSRLWHGDRGFLEFRANAGLAFESPLNGILSLTMGGSYYFVENYDSSFFAGADLGLGLGERKRIIKGGFAAGAHVGMLFMRDYDASLDLRVRADVLAREFGESVPVTLSLIVGMQI